MLAVLFETASKADCRTRSQGFPQPASKAWSNTGLVADASTSTAPGFALPCERKPSARAPEATEQSTAKEKRILSQTTQGSSRHGRLAGKCSHTARLRHRGEAAASTSYARSPNTEHAASTEGPTGTESKRQARERHRSSHRRSHTRATEGHTGTEVPQARERDKTRQTQRTKVQARIQQHCTAILLAKAAWRQAARQDLSDQCITNDADICLRAQRARTAHKIDSGWPVTQLLTLASDVKPSAIDVQACSHTAHELRKERRTPASTSGSLDQQLTRPLLRVHDQVTWHRPATRKQKSTHEGTQTNSGRQSKQHAPRQFVSRESHIHLLSSNSA